MRNTCIARLVTPLGVAVTMVGGAAAQDTVKVEMVMPLTGTLASAGKQVVAGARLYMSQHGNMVAGKQIELVVKDGTSSFEVGKRLIQEAIVNDKADIIAGGLTGDLLASASLITEAKKPTVIMLSSTSAVIDKSPYFLRTSCTLSQSSRIMADWAIKNDIKKVVTLVSDFSPGHEAEATFKDGYLAAAARSWTRSASRCRIRILRRSCNVRAMRPRRRSLFSFPRSRPAPSPSSSWNADWTRPGSS
jgi:branched-chain amino acid transport system substrate-binding protein